GTEIGDAMDVWDKYLDELNPHVPQMTKDFERLADVATTYDEALPDLLSALEAMTTTSKTMVDRKVICAACTRTSSPRRIPAAAGWRAISRLLRCCRPAAAKRWKRCGPMPGNSRACCGPPASSSRRWTRSWAKAPASPGSTWC